MKLDYTEEEIKNLEKEFSTLNNIKDKFTFWIEKLNMPYFRWNQYDYNTIRNFKIKSESKEAQVKINEMLLEHYIERDIISKKKIVFDYELMKDSFLQKYDKTLNQREFLEYEIKAVERRVNEKEGCFKSMIHSGIMYYEKGYSEFYFDNKKPDLEREYEIENLISLMNGYTLAQYHIFLKEYLNKPVAKDKFTHIQQIWILEYLGIGKDIKTNTKKAEIYAPILRRDEETTRQLFSKINSEKNAENLNEIFNYFDKNGFTEQSQSVKKDIDKIKKKNSSTTR